MLTEFPKRKNFSEDVIHRLRKSLIGVPANFAVVAVGSVARREACDASDLDYFLLFDDGEEDHAKAVMDDIKATNQPIVPKAPSSHGPFAQPESTAGMLMNIGGEYDGNFKITRRILLLLEGEWLANREKYISVRNEILRLYVRDAIAERTIARFLLNDFIRYYRTISVDFEHKTTEAGKDWGDRYVKLIFPRKLIYFGGILAIAETQNLTAEQKRETLRKLFDMPPIERIHHICGDSAIPTLKIYDRFLSIFASSSTRDTLKALHQCDRKDCAVFCDLKALGQDFTSAFRTMLEKKYDAEHPIFSALLA